MDVGWKLTQPPAEVKQIEPFRVAPVLALLPHLPSGREGPASLVALVPPWRGIHRISCTISN